MDVATAIATSAMQVENPPGRMRWELQQKLLMDLADSIEDFDTDDSAMNRACSKEADAWFSRKAHGSRDRAGVAHVSI